MSSKVIGLPLTIALSVIRALGQQNAAVELTKSFRGVVVQQDIPRPESESDEGGAFRWSSIPKMMRLPWKGEVYLPQRTVSQTGDGSVKEP